MKITIITTSDQRGGAARATNRIFNAIRDRGVSIKMLCKGKTSEDKDIEQTYGYNGRIKSILANSYKHYFIDSNRSSFSDTLFSLPFFGEVNISKIECIDNCDIINLHWINNYLSIQTISSFIKLGKPVVWTLHDQWPFTGGCHYSNNCNGYMRYCENCPQILEHRELPSLFLREKIEEWSDNITIISPSKWLAECAERSMCFKNSNIYVIPNPISCDVFFPIKKSIAKGELGLDKHVFTILFGAENHKERRKGFSHLVNTLKELLVLVDAKKLHILTFGCIDEEIKQLKIPFTELGYVNDDNVLRTIYSASEITILPSEEDNLPNIILESMACETPVYGFNIGGLPDLINNNVGFLVEPYDYEKLSLEISLIMCNNERLRDLQIKARHHILEHCNYGKVSEQYLDVFSDVIELRNCKFDIKNKVVRRKAERKKIISIRSFLGIYSRVILVILKKIKGRLLRIVSLKKY